MKTCDILKNYMAVTGEDLIKSLVTEFKDSIKTIKALENEDLEKFCTLYEIPVKELLVIVFHDESFVAIPKNTTDNVCSIYRGELPQ